MRPHCDNTHGTCSICNKLDAAFHKAQALVGSFELMLAQIRALPETKA